MWTKPVLTLGGGGGGGGGGGESGGMPPEIFKWSETNFGAF